MKLRIRGNSLRLRLQQSEVKQLCQSGTIRDSVCFGPGNFLNYSIESDGAASSISASYFSTKIVVRIPSRMLVEWATTQAVSLSATQVIDDSTRLKLLVEKDFQCLETRSVWPEDETDNYPNPNTHC